MSGGTTKTHYMLFERIAPDPQLADFIECYWIVEDASAEIRKQKIIPDGFTEIIFHLADPYRICLNGSWQLQSRSLLAGQIRKCFFLENTGASIIIGIKLKPTALTHLYQLNMSLLTDDVVDIHEVIGGKFHGVEQSIRSATQHSERITTLNNYFRGITGDIKKETYAVDRAIDLIGKEHGMVTMAALCEVASVKERQLENLFKEWVGLPPKFFTRMIRFNYIFELVNENKQNWSDLAYEAAYYDQSHFIRNFKSFTGENPTDYAFEERNIANFFLKKK
jgi:AraC-like DNA-binding protein